MLTEAYIGLKSDRLLVEIAKPGTVYAGSRFDWTGFITQVYLDGKHTFCAYEDVVPGLGSGGIGFCNDFGLNTPIGYDEAEIGEGYMKIGIGTYSFGGIASYLGLGPTLLEKFQTIAALGFNSVELLPVDLDNDVEDIKKWLDETGLTVTSVHAEPTNAIIDKMAALGGKAVIWAGTPFCNEAEAKEVAEYITKKLEF